MKQAKIRYNNHKQTAKCRGIEFNFTFDSWYSWWLSNGVDKNFTTGNSASTPCMCRYNDIGAYDIANVYLGNKSNNMKYWCSNNDTSLGNNSNAKAIKTPQGVFDTCTQAAQAYNKSRKWIYRRIGQGFEYI
jgi:hypothetical protein